MRRMNDEAPGANAKMGGDAELKERMRRDAMRLEGHAGLVGTPHVDLRMLEAKIVRRRAGRQEFLFTGLSMTSMVVFLVLTFALVLRIPLVLGLMVAFLILGFLGGLVALFYMLIQYVNFKEAIPR